MIKSQREDHSLLEAYKNIRTSILVKRDIKTILVTSSEMNEGKTTVVSNLAKSFSQLDGKKILLIDCDLRKPSINRHFGLENEKGLIDIVEDKNFKAYIQKVDDLHILTTGKKTSRPAELLESDYIKELIEQLKEYYDYIFIDSPPVSRVNDACILANYIDGTIIVSSSNEVDIELAKLTKKRLNKVNANIIGVILNKFKDEDNIYHKYYGYYDEEDVRPGKFRFKFLKRR